MPLPHGCAASAPPEAGDPATLEARYLARDVVYLLGDRDIDPNHSALDKSCGAMAQGPNRYDRGLAFHAYERFLFGEEIATRHTLATVPGVGHDNRSEEHTSELQSH